MTLPIKPPPPPQRISYLVFSITSLIISVYFGATDWLYFSNTSSPVPGVSESPDLTRMGIGYLIGGTLFSYFFALARSNNVTFSQKAAGQGKYSPVPGWLLGALLALIIFLPAAFINSAVMVNWNLGDLLTEAVFHLIQFAVAGILVRKFIK